MVYTQMKWSGGFAFTSPTDEVGSRCGLTQVAIKTMAAPHSLPSTPQVGERIEREGRNLWAEIKTV